MRTTARHRRSTSSSSVSSRLGLRAAIGVGGTAGYGGIDAAATRAHERRRTPSSMIVTAGATVVPGTVLKAGSRELARADVWRLNVAGNPQAPRLVRDGVR